MNWLTKILKKEKKTRKEDGAKEKIVLEKTAEKMKTEVEPVKISKGFNHGVLLAHHLTEKTAGAGAGHKYVFKVSSGSNKVAIKNAVEGRFGVRVKSVSIINAPGKERKRGGQVGFKPGFKKTIVALENGQSIEIT